MSKKKKCFVITPIGDETDPIRRHIEGIIDAAIIPALGEKYDVVVAHKISDPGTITKQIIKEIYNDDLVIANLTNRNPNVMYELAFRHTIGKPVIMISEKGTILPADVIMERTIFYQNDAKGVLELKRDLIQAEEKINFDTKNGPIFDILGDINFDMSILQKTGDSDIKPLEYILNRLTSIEDAISVSNRNSIIERERKLPTRSLVFAYDKDSKTVSNDFLYSRIFDEAELYSAMVESVNMPENDNIIIISFKDKFNRSRKEMTEFFINVLSRNGLEQVVPEI